MFLRLVTAFLLLGSTCCVLPLTAVQKKLTVYVADRHREGSTYYADIWITVRPGYEWRVSEVVIWMRYNTNALNPTLFHNQPVLNLDPELAANGYASIETHNPNYAAVSLDLIAPVSYNNCVVKGGPDGETFRLGTLQWSVVTAREMEMDYVRFADKVAVNAFYHRRPDNRDDIIKNDSINWTTNDQSTNTWQNLYITPSGCGSMFYEQPQSCEENLRPVSTFAPLTRISPHWPEEPGPGLQTHIAYYQYDMNAIALPTSAHSRDFNPSLLTTLLDRVRCRWEAQVDHLLPPVTNYFEWRETAEGGRIYFTTDIEDIDQSGLGAISVCAVTNMARDENTSFFFRDTSVCGGQIYPVAFKKRSEIIFNNTSLLYIAHPHFKWTTNFAGCGGRPDCHDFYDIALHELGHYVGLAHEERNHLVVMTSADVSPLPSKISQCDADNIRRLYNPAFVGDPPDNTYDCSVVNDIPEVAPTTATDALDVYPSLVDNDLCTVVYSLGSRSAFTIRLLDVPGNILATIAHGISDAGQYRTQFSVEHLVSGVYFVLLQSDSSFVARRLTVMR